MAKIPTSLQQRRIVRPPTIEQLKQQRQPTPSKPVQQKAIQQAQTQVQTIEQQIQQQEAQTETEKAQWVQAQQVIDAGKTRFWIQDRSGVGAKVKYLIDRGYRTPLTNQEIGQLVDQQTRPALQKLLERRSEAIQKLETQQTQLQTETQKWASELEPPEQFPEIERTPGRLFEVTPRGEAQAKALLQPGQKIIKAQKYIAPPQYQSPLAITTPRVQPRGTALDIGQAEFKPEVVRKIPDMPPKNITLKDVRWRGFFETSQVKTEANQTYYRYDKKSKWIPIEEAPPQIQDYVEQEIGRGTAYVARRTYGLFPEGTIKDVLFHTPVSSPRYTDLLKFIFFSPAMATAEYQAHEDIFTFGKRKGLQVAVEKPSKITSKQAETILKELQIRGETEKIRDIIRLALQKGKGSKEFKTLSKLLENSLGKSTSSTMIKDVLQQEAMPSSTNQLFGLSVDPGAISPVFMEAEPLVGGLSIEAGRLTPKQRVGDFISLILGQEKQQRELQVPGLAQLPETRTKQDITSPQITISGLRTFQQTGQAQEPVSLLIPKSTTAQITETPTKQRERLTQIPQFFFPGETPTPRPGKPKDPGYIWGVLPPPDRGKIVKKKGYGVEVYREATGKKPHWEKLNKDPLTRESALSEGAEETDKSISARFRITAEKMLKGKKGKVKQPVDTGSKYFEINRHKFREWKQRKGVRTKTPSHFIEREKFRADTFQETSALQKSRQMSSLLIGGGRRPQGKPKSEVAQGAKPVSRFTLNTAKRSKGKKKNYRFL